MCPGLTPFAVFFRPVGAGKVGGLKAALPTIVPDKTRGTALADLSPRGQGDDMQLTVPDEVARGLSEKDAALHLGIGLFVAEEATLGQAARISGVSQGDFLRALGRRKIPVHYGFEELQEDLAAVRALALR